jgi:hypothetical protein
VRERTELYTAGRVKDDKVVGECGRINASFVLVRKPEGRRLLGKLGVGGRMILQRVPSVKVTNSDAKNFSSAQNST